MIDSSSLRRLAGKHVVSAPDGARIGRISAVYESTAEDGLGTFATVTTGLFGTGSSFFPLDGATLSGDEVLVPWSKETVKQAPRVEDDEELTAEEEQRLFAHYGLLDGTVPAPGAGADAGDAEVTRSEERLHVGTERVAVGRARLRKYVVTETVTHTVPLAHEQLRVRREPLTGDVAGPAVRALSEEQHEIVLTAERPVVHKEVVPVERVRLDTETAVEQETVTEQLRKEQVEVLGDVPVEDVSGTGPRLS